MENQKKKLKIAIHSNYSRLYTGFGGNMRVLLKHLFNTGAFDIVELANGLPRGDPREKKQPWKTYGMLLPQEKIQRVSQHPRALKSNQYGAYTLDAVIEEEQPDIYMLIEDFWASDYIGLFDKNWYNKVHTIIHTTLDSLPILPDAVEKAGDIKNFYVWAKFAEEAMHKLGHIHVKTIHGAFETDNFHRLPDNDRIKLRLANNIPLDAFVSGYVFRNQGRKSVPNLLNGFRKFSLQNPEANPYLILHTNWSEGWNIPELIKEYSIDPERVLATYICESCNRYTVKPYKGEKCTCEHCSATDGAQHTISFKAGVTEPQLNEIYNLMDCYVSPFTSGGQEKTLQEAKLTELITLATNYSCGTEYCTEESGGIPLEYAEYRDQGNNQFIKASTHPSSIAKQMRKVWKMGTKRGMEMGKTARDFVLRGFSIDRIGREWEAVFNQMEPVQWEKDWLSDFGKKNALNKDEQTLEEKLFDSDLNERKIALVIPDGISEVILATGLIDSILTDYPHALFYFICQSDYFPVVSHLCPKVIHKLIPYKPEYKDPLFMKGAGKHKGYVDILHVCDLRRPGMASLPVGLGMTDIKLKEEDFELSIGRERYITIHTGIDEFFGNNSTVRNTNTIAKTYDYYDEVLAMFKMYVKEHRTKIVQVGDKKDRKLKLADIDLRGKTTFNQMARIVNNGTLHISNDSYSAYLSNGQTITLYGPTYPRKHFLGAEICAELNGEKPSYSLTEKDKVINRIKPEEVFLDIEYSIGSTDRIVTKAPRKTLFIGDCYNDLMVELIPDSIPSSPALKNVVMNVRMDYLHDENALNQILDHGTFAIVVNEEVSPDIVRAHKDRITEISYEVSLDTRAEYVAELQYAGVPVRLYSHEEDPGVLAQIRLNLFDNGEVSYFEKGQKEWMEKNISVEKDLEVGEYINYDKLRFKTNKVLLSNGKFFLSKKHWLEGIPLNTAASVDGNVEKVIDHEDFWNELMFFYIFEEEAVENTKEEEKSYATSKES